MSNLSSGTVRGVLNAASVSGVVGGGNLSGSIGNGIAYVDGSNAAQKSIVPLSEIVNCGAKYTREQGGLKMTEVIELTADIAASGFIFITDAASTALRFQFGGKNVTQDSCEVPIKEKTFVTISNTDLQIIVHISTYGSIVFGYATDGTCIGTQERGLVDQRAIPARRIEEARLILDTCITAQGNTLYTELDISHFSMSELCYCTRVYINDEKFEPGNSYGYNGTYLSRDKAKELENMPEACIYMRYSSKNNFIRVYFFFNGEVRIVGKEAFEFKTGSSYRVIIQTTDALTSNMYPLYPAERLPDSSNGSKWDMQEIFPSCKQVSDYVSEYTNSSIQPVLGGKQSVLTKGDFEKNADGVYMAIASKIMPLGEISEFSLDLPEGWDESSACIFTFTCADEPFALNIGRTDTAQYVRSYNSKAINWVTSVSELLKGKSYFVRVSGLYGEVGELHMSRTDMLDGFYDKCKRPVNNTVHAYYTESSAAAYEKARNAAIPVLYNVLSPDTEVNQAYMNAIAAADALKLRAALPDNLISTTITPHILEAGKKGWTCVASGSYYALRSKTASGGEHGTKVTFALNPDFIAPRGDYLRVTRMYVYRKGANDGGVYSDISEQESKTFTFITGTNYPANLANYIDVYIEYEQASLSWLGDTIRTKRIKVIANLDVTYDTAAQTTAR